MNTTKKIKIIASVFTLLACNINNSNAQWQHIPGSTNGEVVCFAAMGNYIFAGSDNEPPADIGGIFRSTDNGKAWTAVYADSGGWAKTGSVPALTVSGTHIFAGTRQRGVFLSKNNGISWDTANTGLLGARVTNLFTKGNKVLALTDAGLYMTTTNGSLWTAVNPVGLTASVYTLFLSGSTIFAGTDKGVFLSTNDGATWTAANNGLPPNITANGFAANGTAIFAGTNKGVYLSTDNGASWAAATGGGMPPNLYVTALAVSGNTVFAASGYRMYSHGTNFGVYMSESNGVSWKRINTGLQDSSVMALIVSGNYIYAGTVVHANFDTSSGIWRRPLSELVGVQSLEVQSSKFKVWPNPNHSGLLHIEYPCTSTSSVSGNHAATELVEVEMYDVLGQSVRHCGLDPQSPAQPDCRLRGNDGVLDVSGLEKGIYLLKIRCFDKLNRTQKIIIQ